MAESERSTKAVTPARATVGAESATRHRAGRRTQAETEQPADLQRRDSRSHQLPHDRPDHAPAATRPSGPACELVRDSLPARPGARRPNPRQRTDQRGSFRTENASARASAYRTGLAAAVPSARSGNPHRRQRRCSCSERGPLLSSAPAAPALLMTRATGSRRRSPSSARERPSALAHRVFDAIGAPTCLRSAQSWKAYVGRGACRALRGGSGDGRPVSSLSHALTGPNAPLGWSWTCASVPRS